MTGTAELNATARVRQLIDLTERLTASLGAEAKAFEAHRPQDAAASLAGTQDLANAYRRESAQVKANPQVLAEAARIISEGLVKTIAAEVAAQRGSPSAYGASGRANAGDGRAVAFNRTA